MKTLFATALLAGIFAFGCSSDDGSGEQTQTTDEQTQMAKAATGADSLADKTYPVRDENNPFVTIDTDFGKMTLELYRDVAPAHVDSFLARTKEGFYDGLIFHRIIDNFMIQGGDPKGDGTGNAGYFLEAEFSDLPHQEGTLSMARGPQPNSAGTQFFICLGRNQTTAYLDGKYTVFGQLIDGFDTLHEIGSVPVVANPMNPREVSQPKEEVFMRDVYVSDAQGNPINQG